MDGEKEKAGGQRRAETGIREGAKVKKGEGVQEGQGRPGTGTKRSEQRWRKKESDEKRAASLSLYFRRIRNKFHVVRPTQRGELPDGCWSWPWSCPRPPLCDALSIADEWTGWTLDGKQAIFAPVDTFSLSLSLSLSSSLRIPLPCVSLPFP